MKGYKPLIVLFPTVFFLSFSYASAAPLNWTASQSVALSSSPATTLTIATGSVADAFTVNATSVAVTLSSSTGGSFTLLSPSYDLSVATSSSGGTVSRTCVSNGASVTISQTTGSTIYTIAPLGTACVASATLPAASGTAAVVIVPTVPQAPPAPPTLANTAPTSIVPNAQISSSTTLEQLLAQVQALVQALNVQLTSSFTRNLTVGFRGNDVKNLQIFLNNNGFSIVSSGSGSPGHETDYFGSFTRDALAKYQAANGIAPSSGYFGPLTRAFIKKN